MDEKRPDDEVVVPGDASEADVAGDDEVAQEVMSLLSEHVPLALLADLAMPDGPASPEILTEEGLPEVAWWEPGEEPDDVTGTRESATPTP